MPCSQICLIWANRDKSHTVVLYRFHQGIRGTGPELPSSEVNGISVVMNKGMMLERVGAVLVNRPAGYPLVCWNANRASEHCEPPRGIAALSRGLSRDGVLIIPLRKQHDGLADLDWQ